MKTEMVFFDREKVSEATRSKNTKCKMFTLRALLL